MIGNTVLFHVVSKGQIAGTFSFPAVKRLYEFDLMDTGGYHAMGHYL